MTTRDQAPQDQQIERPRPGMSRRAFVAASAAAAAAAGIAAGVDWAATPAAMAEGPSYELNYDIRDLKHVVFCMIENRSFDHIFGTLPGVRNFADKQVLTFPNGRDVFHQPAPSRTDGGYLVPFHMDSSTTSTLLGGSWDLDHSFEGGHVTWNNGAYDQWVTQKSQLTMGYYTEDDLPHRYALAKNWMVLDASHCSIFGPTGPNRDYYWTGTVDPDGTIGNPAGPVINNSISTAGLTSFARFLQNAGATWRQYNKCNRNDGTLWYGHGNAQLPGYADVKAAVAAMGTSAAAADYVDRAAAVTKTATATFTDFAGQDYLNYVNADFIADVQNNTLPQLSWLGPPTNWTEHPGDAGMQGGAWINSIIEILASNPDVWASTLLLFTYDENDGLFDHVLPPRPEAGTQGEFITGSGSGVVTGDPHQPVGLGPRLPSLLISPWTRGPKTYAGTLDHTSWQQFVEYWLTETAGLDFSATGNRNTNVTEWRRSMTNNVLYALDFKNPDFSVPDLPDPAPELVHHDATMTLPTVKAPQIGQQSFPVVPEGTRIHVPTPYEQHATIAVDRSTGGVTATMTNTGRSCVAMHLYPEKYLPFQAHTFTVGTPTDPSVPGAPTRTWTWDASQTDGEYRFSIYGHDRFLRTFAGTVTQADQSIAGTPEVDAELVNVETSDAGLKLTLKNLGFNQLGFTLTRNDFDGTDQTVFVEGGGSTVVTWPTDADGYYDVIVTDDSDTGFLQRYAGRIPVTAPLNA